MHRNKTSSMKKISYKCGTIDFISKKFQFNYAINGTEWKLRNFTYTTNRYIDFKFCVGVLFTKADNLLKCQL